jgi:hypothetical protein
VKKLTYHELPILFEQGDKYEAHHKGVPIENYTAPEQIELEL